MPQETAQSLGILLMGVDVPPDLAEEPPPARSSPTQHQGGVAHCAHHMTAMLLGCCGRVKVCSA